MFNVENTVLVVTLAQNKTVLSEQSSMEILQQNTHVNRCSPLLPSVVYCVLKSHWNRSSWIFQIEFPFL